jgi:hypothetical protein
VLCVCLRTFLARQGDELIDDKIFEGVVFHLENRTGETRLSIPPTLTAAEGADDLNVITGAQWGGESSRLLIIDKNFDVLSDRILFGDDAKAETGALPVECGEHLS